MRKLLFIVAVILGGIIQLSAQPKVFMTKEITPESLVRVYKALGVEPHGHVP